LALALQDLSVVIKHPMKSPHTGWVMTRARLGSDSLSHLRADWSAPSGRLNVESDPGGDAATSHET